MREGKGGRNSKKTNVQQESLSQVLTCPFLLIPPTLLTTETPLHS